MGDCEPHENAVNKCNPPKNHPRDADCPKVGNLNLTRWAIWISVYNYNRECDYDQG